MGQSGNESYSMGYGTTATLASNVGFWVQSGTGSIGANSLFGYSYSGAGSGSSGTDDGYGDTSSTSWNLNEHGSGGGTSDYSQYLTLENGAWSGSPSLSSTDRNESVYSYNGSTAASYAYSGETQSSTTTISDDEIITTDSNGAGWSPTVTTTYGGSGWANGSNDSSGSGGPQDDNWSASWSSQGSGGTSLSYTTASGGGSLESSGMLSFWYELGWGQGLVSAAEPGAIPGQVAFGAGPLEGDTDGLKISGGVDFPGTADYYAPTLGYPQVPPYCEGPSFVFGRPTLPGAVPSTVAVSMQASSLAGLAPSPVMVNAVWGMALTAQAGESPVGGPGSWHMAYSATAAPQTPFALGNTVGASAAFTSEKIRATDAVFGALNAAAAIPVTQSPLLLNYGFKGVSAGIAAGQPAAGTDPLTNVLVPVCFAAGTPILMADGTSKAIERIERGDRVRAVFHEDPEGPLSAGEVVEVYHNGPRKLVEVEVGGQMIRVTPKHPFYVRGRGFTAAAELRPGDSLRTASGGWIAAGSVVDNGRVEPVFNFDVAGLHTYFVGKDDVNSGVLVHNRSGGAEQATLHVKWHGKFVVLQDPTVRLVGKELEISGYEDGSSDRVTYPIPLKYLDHALADPKELAWVRGQVERPAAPPAAQAPRMLRPPPTVDQILRERNQRLLEGRMAGAGYNTYADARTALIFFANEAGAAVGAFAGVVYQEGLGAKEFGFDSAEAAGQFLAQLKNAPLSTTYRTVVGIGSGFYAVLTNPSILGNAVDGVLKDLFSGDPRRAGRAAANIAFSLYVPGGEAKGDIGGGRIVGGAESACRRRRSRGPQNRRGRRREGRAYYH